MWCGLMLEHEAFPLGFPLPGSWPYPLHGMAKESSCVMGIVDVKGQVCVKYFSSMNPPYAQHKSYITCRYVQHHTHTENENSCAARGKAIAHGLYIHLHKKFESFAVSLRGCLVPRPSSSLTPYPKILSERRAN